MRAPASRPDLLEVTRLLLLLQAAILITNTVEATIFGLAFSGGLTPTVLMTAAAAVAILVGRARLDLASARGRRPIYLVEALIVASLGIDTALAIIVTHQPVPLVAVLTRFVLPVAIVALLGQMRVSARARTDAALGEAA